MSAWRSIFLINLLLLTPLLGQFERAPGWAEAGLPYVHNFTVKQYRGNPQNWAVIQDKSGIIYIANGHGVMVFDGVSWEMIPVCNSTAVRSLALHRDTLFVGAQNEFGYLKADSRGQLLYHSLRMHVPVHQREFADVWQTFSIDDAVWFRTTNYLFKWHADSIHTILPNDRFHSAFAVNNSLYLRAWGVGMMRVENDSLYLLPGGAQFANERVYMLVPYDSTRLLLGSRTKGMFLFDGKKFSSFPTTIDDFLLENQISHGTKLPGGLFAISTLKGGVAIIDSLGRLCQILNRETGLDNQNAKYVFPDRDGGLWIALNNGLARAEVPAPYSTFGANSGIPAITETMIRHNGEFFLGTHNGMFALKTENKTTARFERVPGINSQVWDFEPFDDLLLVCANEGIYAYSKHRIRKIRAEPVSVYTLHRSRLDSTTIFIGSINGLSYLRLQNGEWQEWQAFPQVNGSITSISEATPGMLWIGTKYSGIYRAQITNAREMQAEVSHFDSSNGLPYLKRLLTVVLKNQVRFLTNNGLKKFEPQQNRFVPDTTFGAMLADSSTWLFQAHEDDMGRLWTIGNFRKESKRLYGYFYPDKNDRYHWAGDHMLRFNNLGLYYNIHPEPNGVTWIAGSEGVGRYNANLAGSPVRPAPTLVRRITGISDDSLFFGGAHNGYEPIRKIDFAHHSLRFTFAAPYFNALEENRYRVKLDGFDKNWSNWTSETKKDYTGLPAGNYRFRVQARNVYDQLSEEGSFAFVILPPWYHSWWAYLFYIFSSGILIAGLVKWRVRHLEMKTRKLEQIVSERTQEITAQKDQIAQQAEALKELDHAKSRFFANISHEFRTPLTLILGPLEDRLAVAKSATDQQELGLMHRNASRLLHLINQLLDISRLESGKLSLAVSAGDFPGFLRGVVMSFASLANQKGILLNLDLRFPESINTAQTEWFFDADKIEKIFINLLANALKFTPKNGTVTVIADMLEARVRVRVRDTGIGIADDMRELIFDRFERADKTADNKFMGSGIGLALTKELVELHHGCISVKSEPGQGSEFTVILPMRKKDFSKSELTDAPSSTAHAALPTIDTENQAAENFIAAAKNVDETVVLIVEDHSDVRAYIRKQLDAGYTILEAADGETGAQLATEMVPDLVISDIMMGEMDGYQLCEHLKTNEKTSHIPVILLTAKAGEESKLTGLATGADDYLTKPFNAKELLARTHNLITQRRRLRERFHKEGLLQPRTTEAASVDEQFLQKLMQHIEENLAEEDFTVEKLALKMNMTARQLHRKVTALSGRSPVELIRHTRLIQARNLLEKNAGSVSEIAFQVGFNNLSYFARMFKEAFGKAPSEWGK